MDVIRTHGLDSRHAIRIDLVDLAGKRAADLMLMGGEADVITTDWLWVSRQRSAGSDYTFLPYSRAVGAVMVDNQVLNNPAIIVPRTLYDKAVPAAVQGDFLVYVKAKPGADAEGLRTQLTDVVKPFIVVSVQDGKEFTSSQADQINTFLYIMYALLALTVIIAILGIINTMALSVFERTREIGLLRAVGLSRRQLRRMITLESVETSVFGSILGAVLGLAIGIVVQRGLVNQGLEKLSIPWLQIVLVVVGAAIAGVLAAILPAWRAVRLDVLRAISTE